MKEFVFEFYEEKKTGEIIQNSLSIKAKTFEEAKMIVNTQMLLSNSRLVFDWFPMQEENKFTGVRIFC